MASQFNYCHLRKSFMTDPLSSINIKTTGSFKSQFNLCTDIIWLNLTLSHDHSVAKLLLSAGQKRLIFTTIDKETTLFQVKLQETR